jgi:hypothetical protein
MCSATMHEAKRNIAGSFFWFGDFEVGLQELPVRQFVHAHLGGNLSHHVL